MMEVAVGMSGDAWGKRLCKRAIQDYTFTGKGTQGLVHCQAARRERNRHKPATRSLTVERGTVS
ncbi:hypothetical protein [Dictyobacter arantiisoli]|uniref:Uncharacterized protein n=1 Tax=Dictyobacter arantiisoli TaxID=2014874 RepID=A0A5A5TG08_9CHLR|nr:hypothetical protein [Dictyobacter arantiisoli]GCF10155.1 hypothetical protein KDI_37190 [Dictyobacter arantiisoli]